MACGNTVFDREWENDKEKHTERLWNSGGFPGPSTWKPSVSAGNDMFESRSSRPMVGLTVCYFVWFSQELAEHGQYGVVRGPIYLSYEEN